MTCPAKFPCSAASLLCPFRVARVSRLIGKSHTTANSCGWQVNSEALRLPALTGAGPKIPPNARNATLNRVALHCSALVTGLPNNLRTAVVSAVPTSDFPGRSASFKDRFVGGCSCRVSALLWAGQNSSSVQLPQMRPPPSSSGSISAPPASPGGPA